MTLPAKVMLNGDSSATAPGPAMNAAETALRRSAVCSP